MNCRFKTKLLSWDWRTLSICLSGDIFISKLFLLKHSRMFCMLIVSDSYSMGRQVIAAVWSSGSVPKEAQSPVVTAVTPCLALSIGGSV